jgi:hypothetical protein
MFNSGILSKARGVVDSLQFGEIQYHPRKLTMPAKLVASKSQAWVGLEKLVLDIIEFAGIEQNKALEFGVEFGYSTAAFANYFRQVTGVDIFTGDPHAGFRGDIFEETKNNLRDFNNITLVKADYKDFIAKSNETYDLAHVDIIHTYEDTYRCGLWSAEHSRCTLFHDTQSFRTVKMAVSDIARKTGKKFYNYRNNNGLGILVAG